MGKITKRYQTRRILAMILAVTMVVGMIPSTALAAPGSDGEQTVENAVTAQTTEGTGDKSPAEGADADEDSDAAGTENTAAGDNTTTGTEDNADGEGDVPAGTDNSSAGNDTTADTAGDNTPADTDESTAGNSTPAATDDPAPAAEKPVYEIVTDDLETEVVYTGYSAFNLSSVWLAKTENGETESTDEAVTAAWEKQGTDGNYTAMAAGADPVDVGVYKLKLTCAAVADVHDAVTAEVICEITKAPVKILIGDAENGKIPVAIGVLDVQSIKPTIGRIVCAGSNLDPEDLVLTVNGVRNAITGAEVKDGDKLKRDGDYVVDITPSFKADAAADRKAVYANYELEDFTADLIVADLIETRVEVKLADKWKTDEDIDATTVIAKEYDTKSAAAPKAQKSAEDTEYDYTYVVKYWDSAADDWAPLNDKDGKAVQAVGEWDTYDGCELGEDGKVLPPTDAGVYTYKVVYTDAEGIYNTSSAEFFVEIEPAVIKVEATNKGPLKVLEGATAQEVLSQVTYKVTDKEGKENDFISTKAMKAGNVWGTGFDDSNVSQIYEPLFTLQESADGSSWQSIDDADYELASDKKYRVIYDGKKAIYNANGTYSHRTDVNDDANINGVDYNYATDTTPTADDKALAVEVTPGTEVTIDVSKLVGDKKGALTIADLTAKIYDGKPIYSARSEYKNEVTVKPKDDTAKGPDKTLLREFTYTWEQYGSASDLLDAQIQDENQANGFADWGPADDDDDWLEIDFDGVSPKNAGVYRLTITYEDQYDDGKLYYAKEPAVVYYAIDSVQVKIVPKGEYKELEGHNGYDLLRKPHDKNTYELQEVKGAVVSGDNVVPRWEIIETRQQEAPAEPVVYTYDYDSCWDFNFEKNDTVSYALQGGELGQFYNVEDEDGYVSYIFGSNFNYTCYSSEKAEVGEANASGKKELERRDTFLNETAPITVNPIGTKKLTVEVDAAKWGTKEKEYDAKPFELKELLQGGAVTVKDEDGKVLTDQELGNIGFEYVGYIPGNDNFTGLEWITEAGEYVLYASFYGNETYAPLKSPENPADPWSSDDWGVKIGAFGITQKTISLNVNLPETYTAGVTAEDVLNAIPGNITVKGYAEDDAGSFTEYRDWDEETEESHYYMWAWSYDDYKQDPSFQIYEKGAKRPVDNDAMLARDKIYEVKYDAEYSSLTQFYNWWTGKYSYIISTGAAAEFTVVKGNSVIESIDKDEIESVAIRVKNDEKDSMKRTVTILEGIGFSSITLEDDTMLEGNLAAFRITPPAEYGYRMPDTAMYKNAITAANVNGYVTSENGRGFTVIFDAREGTKTFPIRWEDGYVETYTIDFDNAVKLGDLNNAVAPKSLAFNAPDKKMAVGQSQQLDVKITKVQMGDVICLGYKSSDETVLTVNENGYVTALKYPGKANITVFPQHKVNGEMEPIPGAKTATVAITTTKMTAPKAVKVVTHGSTGAYVNLNYDTPKDGYRREIYVVNNNVNPSLKKAADFEKLLAGTGEDSWKENKWQGTFAIAPLYLDSADESLNRRRNGYTARLSGLATQGAYTVYVRNVCAARTLANGSVITNETVNASAAGIAVSFKTLKSELTGLKYELDDTAAGVTDISYDYDGEVWDDGEEYIDNAYRIELSKIAKGAVDGTTYGLFYTMPKDEAADGYDMEWIALPLKEKLDKNSYENPKLEYALDECWNKKTQRYEFGSKNDIASIDKKGKIKITGMTGEDQRLVVRVRDTQTGTRTYVALHIMAEADSVMAKKKSITLSVGQRQDLGELLSYKMGKQKLTYYPYADIDMNAVKTAIKDQKQETFFELDQHGSLWAIAKGGNLQLELIDRNVANSFGKEKATAKVTFKTTDLTPVKKIKAYDVINDRFGLTFTYAGGADAFLVEIADANKTIYSKRFARAGVAEDSETGLWAQEEWDSKGNRVKDTYRIDMLGNVRDEYDQIDWNRYVRLTKETQYTVKITALYDAIAAKPATAKVKTTKIPAISGYIGDDHYDDEPYNTRKHRGGMSIQVGEYDDGRELNEGNRTLRVLSGNSYTLTANVEYNRGRVNDTLVWTVDNAKVATVKAAAGSYCITLKGVKPGNTVLEVKSKIWGNKVVARYDIYVVAVGNAYKNTNRYYGDNEPGGSTSPSINNGGNNAPANLPLSVGDPRKVTVNQTEYFSFTAPETGRYEMTAEGSVGESIYLYKYSSSSSSSNSGYRRLDLGWLQAGEPVRLSSSVSVDDEEAGNIAYYVEVTLAQKVETVSSGQTIQGTGAQGIFKFTAPEDGTYEFSIEDQSGNSQYLYLYRDESAAIGNGSYDKSGRLIECDMNQGEEGSVWLKTNSTLYSWNEYTFHAEKISEDISLGTPAEITVAKNGGKKYLTFTVADDGYYKFSSQADTASSNINVSLQVNDATVDSSSYNSEFTFKQELHAGDKVCLVIENTDYYNDYTFKVSAESFEIPDLTAGTPVTVNTDGDVYKFTAATAGIYRFSADSGATVFLYMNATDALKRQNDIHLEATGEKEMSAGEEFYLAVTLNNAASSQLNVSKISQDLDLANGSVITVGGYGNAYVTFSVPQDGYYKIASADGTTSDTNIRVELVVNGDGENAVYEYNAAFEFKKDLKQGDVVRLKITNSGAGDSTFTVKAEAVTIDAVPENGTTLAANSENTVYKFTAADTGIYQFRMESTEQDTSLYLWNSMEELANDGSYLAATNAVEVTEEGSDGGASGGGSSKYVCTIDILLSAGQIVYVNPRNASSTDNLAITLNADKKTVSTLTASSSTIAAPANEIAEVIYTASEDGIYTFHASGATDSVYIDMYKSYGGNEDYGLWDNDIECSLSGSTTSAERQIVLTAGQTVVWTLRAQNTDQNIDLSVIENRALKALHVDDTLEAECNNTAEVFTFTAPSDGWYTFWSTGGADTYGLLYSADQVNPARILEDNSNNEGDYLEQDDDDGPSMNFAISYELKSGQTVYLKARFLSSGNSGTFDVHAEAGVRAF